MHISILLFDSALKAITLLLLCCGTGHVQLHGPNVQGIGAPVKGLRIIELCIQFGTIAVHAVEFFPAGYDAHGRNSGRPV